MVDICMPDDEKEGTQASVGKWLKRVGDPVAEHEPLLEISTDKVTLEIAAPASGVLREIHTREGDPVSPGELLGRMESGNAEEPGITAPLSQRVVSEAGAATSSGQLAESTYSPAVRKLLRELGVDPRHIPKVGRGGRITPDDVAAYLKGGAAQEPEAAGPSRAAANLAQAGRRIPHTPMRKSIADHMARSVRTAPHVTSVFEADLAQVLADRERRKQERPGGTAPSVTAYLIRAAVQAIKVVPEVNSEWHDTHLQVFDHVNFGVGTALDCGGLVVPMIRDAQTLDLDAISQALREMTAKARAGKLSRADMEGGTFTLSNHGVSGSLLAAPIILPHGQAAILGAGKLQKRVVVCETGGRELFRVRPMMYVTLTVDHRALDGQQTNAFLTAFVEALESVA